MARSNLLVKCIASSVRERKSMNRRLIFLPDEVSVTAEKMNRMGRSFIANSVLVYFRNSAASEFGFVKKLIRYLME